MPDPTDGRPLIEQFVTKIVGGGTRRTKAETEFTSTKTISLPECGDNVVVQYPGFLRWADEIDTQQLDAWKVSEKDVRMAIDRYMQQREKYALAIASALSEGVALSDTGTALIAEIDRRAGALGNTGTPLLAFMPQKAAEIDKGPYTIPRAERSDQAIEDGTALGEVVRDDAGYPIMKKRGAMLGTGRGTPATIHFTPGLSPVSAKKSPDKTAIHEMSHAVQLITGFMASRPAASGMDTETEFVAISVENLYRSEFGASKFRKDHGSNATAKLSVKKYVSEPTRMRVLDRFRNFQHVLYDDLVNIDADFNPFAAHKQFRTPSVPNSGSARRPQPAY